MQNLSFAIRNVIRNRSRALVTMGAMGFALFIMVIYAALLEGLTHTFERNVVGMELGEIQIHAKGYRDDPDLYKRIHEPAVLTDSLTGAGFHAVPRLIGFGLAAYGLSSAGVQLRGLDVDREAKVTMIHNHVMSGSWLDKEDLKGVVIGKKLARTLNVKLGDEVVILGQAADGSMANDLFTVRGILKSVGEQVDRGGFFMVEESFRELMALPEGAHEIAILRKDFRQDLQEATRIASHLAPNLETKNWRELRPVVAKTMDSTDISLFIMLLITYTAIGMVSLNAMLMSVFERIKEFGVMKAVGMPPWKVAYLIFTEAMVQAMLAGIFGLALGIPAALYLQTYGIDLSSFISGGSFGGVAIDPIWYARITPSSVLSPLTFLLVITMLAVVYPCAKAALIRPIKAIYHR